ncbi:Spy/CpxP family protein refolding chaperone [Marinobacter sp. CHS3-4]|uniref:Spy/CpxP family protein refolding chaperone n=1 Tax=Marinobacter sp. CHS3-4 TaxID=3045174 RepID=UPI0024B5826D|nr:Spy/CpxP family protein refolding chaperone [Marinobacter sp. CHS3-4]MDI9246198.1 Spy/CpxP family protein refolding chaperone [Marinobacter sp. CHS3-4]
MKLVKLFGIALIALGLSAPTLAQQPDQVDQLAKMVGLSDDQQTEIRGILDEMQAEIQALNTQAQQLQQEIQGQIKPDYDEASIRENAAELGEITGEIAALSTIMQAKVDSVFTEEQREQLNQRMQQMQQQMQQRRQMQQQQ